MYLVKLDLSVKGLSASATRGCTRHGELYVESDTPLGAIEKASSPVFCPELTTLVSDILLCVARYVACNLVVLPWSSLPVVIARYTVFLCSDCGKPLDKISKVATYVRDFRLTHDND